MQENTKLATVLDRFRQTRSLHAANRSTPDVEHKAKIRKLAPVVAQGLSALPQPESSADQDAKPALSWPVPPRFVDPNGTKSFRSLGVSERVCTRLEQLGYEHAFAVQTAVIPAVLEAQCRLAPDPLPPILVNSSTGSGKTLAYLVPIIDVLSADARRGAHRLRALVLLPTKVLMAQVRTVADELAKGTGLQVLALKSGRSLQHERELLEQSTPDIVISAPGRLVEHVKTNPDLLASLKFVVVDEADRLVGQSFQNWTAALREVLPPQTHATPQELWQRPPQRLIFSATLTRDPAKLEDLQASALTAPILFVVGVEQLDGKDEFALPVRLRERLLRLPSLGDKPLGLVAELLHAAPAEKSIVFVRSNEAAARLARLVTLVASIVFGATLNAYQCSGEMRAQDRRRVLREFETDSAGVLVCTDLIARGIDMPISCVVNYDLPMGPREYVHRVGRTARANAAGLAITLVTSNKEANQFTAVQAGVARTGTVEEETLETTADPARYELALKELEKEVTGQGRADAEH